MPTALFVGCVVMCVVSHVSLGQQHFADCLSQTGVNATLIIPGEPGSPLAWLPEESEIAVYTEDGVCSGVVVWTGTPAAISIWGDDPIQSGKTGFVQGEGIDIRVWDGRREYRMSRDQLELHGADVLSSRPFSSPPQWFPDALFSVETLRRSDGAIPLAGEPLGGIPEAFALGQNYPNPFYPTTTISYALAASSYVTLELYSVDGRRVATVVEPYRKAGFHSITLNLAQLASGAYLYRLIAGNHRQSRRMMVLR